MIDFLCHMTSPICIISFKNFSYSFRGLIQRPPASRDITIHAIAIQENILLSTEKPTVKNAMPRTRKTMDILRLFSFIDPFFLLGYCFGFISEYGV